jgi:hypothetical protein
MAYSMKSENKLDGASNFIAWKTRIDLILSKNKVLHIMKGKIVEPEFEEGKEKEPQNIAVMEKFRKIGQVMSLKNELCDMTMNDDDNITSYFVRIS